MKSPTPAVILARAVAQAGGQAYLVGGWVRDRLLGLDAKDLDVEVHGLPEDELAELLEGLGRVNAVGRSFGVYKVRVKGQELDVSLPRRDSKVGPGHRGIAVEGDPFMGVVEASRRRDLTLNALMLDPLTGEITDPHGGLVDLEAGVLREVDPQTFEEDPLRALRAVQFAARFGFTLAPSLAELCRQAPLDELPAERIRGELDKLLLKAPRPGVGVLLLRDLGLGQKALPALAPTLDEALAAATDRAAALRRGLQGQPARAALMYATLFHELDEPGLVDCMDRLQLHTLQRWPVRRRIQESLALLQDPPSWSDAELRALADTHWLRLVFTLLQAVTPGEGGEALLARAEALGVADEALPRLAGGGELRALGVAPGPAYGELLARLRKAQHEGRVCDPEGAMALLRSWVEGPSAED